LVEGGRVSCNYFDALAAKPILGRTFTAEDDRSGAPHVVILSGGLWQGRYAGDPKVIGRSISIGGEAYTVVGVMPGTFQFTLMRSEERRVGKECRCRASAYHGKKEE